MSLYYISTVNLKQTVVDARRSFADGFTDVLGLAKLYKVSPSQMKYWISHYDFQGYTDRREKMLADFAVKEATSEDDGVTTAVNLLKEQLVFAVREGDIVFNTVNEVKTFVETIHLIEGKPTQITKSLDETLSPKQLENLTGPEAMAIAIELMEKYQSGQA